MGAEKTNFPLETTLDALGAGVEMVVPVAPTTFATVLLTWLPAWFVALPMV